MTMPNGRRDDEPVLWGRWNEAHTALEDRVSDLEGQNRSQFARIEADERAVASAEENRRALAEQVDRLRADSEARRGRTWTLATILLTSLAMPLLVVLVTVWLHLRTSH
jgi:Flp pilus assembly protein TadB